MSYTDFAQLLSEAKQIEPARLSVAAAEDRPVLEAVKKAKQEGLQLTFTLVGHEDKIKQLLKELGFDELKDNEILHADAPRNAAAKAVQQVSRGDCDYLMKGLVSTRDFLKEVLDQEYGLRTGRLLSHLAAFEVPNFPRVLFVSDGGINPAPTLEEKEEILKNAVEFMKDLGMEEPKVAVLGAVETVNPQMEATTHGAILAKMQDRGQIKGAFVDGPMALDNAVNEEAAEHKGVTGPVAGKADLLLVPDIESGNVLGKAITFLGQGAMAGLVLGAQVPVVLTSRADSVRSKLTSIALGAIASKA